LPLLHRQMIEVLGIKNADKLVPIEDDQVPTDPVQENQNILTGKPAKAFIEQNHQAHIAVHMSAMQDPKIQAIVGQNPMAQQLQAAMMAHINEHVAFEYRKQLETEMGMVLPGEEANKNVSPELANEIAVKAAAASQRLLQSNQQQAQQAQAQQAAQDPVLQMQQQELQLKMKELELKIQKQQIDAAAKADQIRLEEARIQSQQAIAKMQIDAQTRNLRAKLAQEEEIAGAKLGVDIAKDKAKSQPPRR